MEIKPLKLFSYSRSAADDHCRMSRYLAKDWGGTGLQSVREAWPLLHGNIIHKAMEVYLKSNSVDFKALRQQTIDEAMKFGFDQIAAQDWAMVVEGQIRGCITSVLLPLLAEYKVIDVEKWVVLDLPDDFRFRARQDLLLQSKFDGHYCYIDWKNTSTTKPQWVASWAKSVQLHSSLYAIRKSTGLDVDRAVIVGLYKGYEDKKLNTQRSIFSYGWVNRQFTMSPDYSYEYQRSKGWELFRTWEEFDQDGEQWLAKMPKEILSEQFPRTAPIFYREDIAEEWFAQQLIREAEIAEAQELLKAAKSVDDINAVMRKYYKQNFSHCQPAWGYECEYLNYCWIPHVKADPIGSGQFERCNPDLED